MFAPVAHEVVELDGGFFGQAGDGPDLPVRVRVRAAHGCSLVFEDLHVAVLNLWGGTLSVWA